MSDATGEPQGGQGAGAGYQVVARRFRPHAFHEVVGQDAILTSLKGALSSDRVPHAFLFSGSRGVGKTTTARLLAMALNCETRGPGSKDPEPCGTCGACAAVLHGSNPDVSEIDAASHNLVEDIRALRERVGYASMGGRYKVYILDEVHMLSRSAFNAFLKTLEEPPAKVVFVLATTELHKVPDTIRSRCQVLRFRRVDEDGIQSRLRAISDREGLPIPDEVLAEIAAGARGGMRDAETALERILPVAQELGEGFDLATYRKLVNRVGLERATDVAADLLAGQTAPALHFAHEVLGDGMDEREALGELLDVLRAALLIALDGPETTLVSTQGVIRERLVELAKDRDPQQIDAVVQAGLIGRDRLRRMEDRTLVLETTLLHMASAGQLPTLAQLAAGGVATAPAGGGAAPGRAAAPARAPDRQAVPGRSADAVPPPAGGSPLARLIALVKKDKPLLERTLEHCELVGPEAGGPDAPARAVLKLRTQRKIHVDRLRAKDLMVLIRDRLSELHGGPVNLQIDTGEGAASGGSPGGAAGSAPRQQAPAPGGDAEPAPGVKKIAARFDGRIVDLSKDRLE